MASSTAPADNVPLMNDKQTPGSPPSTTPNLTAPDPPLETGPAQSQTVESTQQANESSEKQGMTSTSDSRDGQSGDKIKSESGPQVDSNEPEAIGPSSEGPIIVKPNPDGEPAVMITLLLTSGARHPYKIDEKYLTKRGVQVESMDPFLISVYTLKELIWRDWREEWETRPLSPGAIRLISFGRMLDDKLPLKECRFQAESPNIVHMTVKPQDVIDEEDAKTGKGNGRDRGDGEATAGCRCVIL